MKKHTKKKITVLLIGYMLAVALCASGIILNSDIASASNGGLIGDTKSPTLDIVLWALISAITVFIVTAVMLIVHKDKKTKGLTE